MKIIVLSKVVFFSSSYGKQEKMQQCASFFSFLTMCCYVKRQNPMSGIYSSESLCTMQLCTVKFSCHQNVLLSDITQQMQAMH